MNGNVVKDMGCYLLIKLWDQSSETLYQVLSIKSANVIQKGGEVEDDITHHIKATWLKLKGQGDQLGCMGQVLGPMRGRGKLKRR